MLSLTILLLVFCGYGTNADSPCETEEMCSKNERYVTDDVSCPRTCGNRLVPGQEVAGACIPYTGCACDFDYMRLYDNATGPCISENECAPIPTDCEVNEEPSSCKVVCPPQTCESIYTTYPCTARECEPGCNCKNNYLRDSKGVCILSDSCGTGESPVVCTRPNEEWNPQPSSCLAERCKDITKGPLECTKFQSYASPACVCKEGFYRNESDICVPASECYMCESRNATFSYCPYSCPPTCDKPDSTDTCVSLCGDPGCVCQPGYILTAPGGDCVHPRDCPGGCPFCAANETYANCKVGCPTDYCSADDSHAVVACSTPHPCRPGCVCKKDYLRLSEEDNHCILTTDCPPVKCTGPNEEWNPEPSSCLAEGCEDITKGSSECDRSYPYGEPACVCKQGFYRNDSDICVPASECFQCETRNATYSNCPSACPATCDEQNTSKLCILLCKPPGCECNPGYVLAEVGGHCVLPEDCPANPTVQCGHNEVAVECRTICPPQNCEISYTEYACGEVKCEPGCDCLPNHLRNSSGICIPNDECANPTSPICGINEIARDCRRICPPQTCESLTALYKCAENIPCEPGCDCIKNYLRNASGVCIPSEECFQTPTCPVPPEHRRTCALPNPPNSPYNPPENNIDGCDCQKGYILSKEGGTCIKIEDCPNDVGCNGDPHAKVKPCPDSCPSTCSSPNVAACEKKCEPIGCQCTGGYILSEKDGKCILPDDCPNGNPCGPNGRFVECRYNCPNDYCPVDDSRATIVCDPYPVCLSGCICKVNHKKLSYENETCVESSSCPPVQCKRSNEEWNSCPSACLAERCENIDEQPIVCNTLLLNCEPKCVCKKNYFRDSTDTCVSVDECRSTSSLKKC